MSLYSLFRPLVFTLEAEKAHRTTITALKLRSGGAFTPAPDGTPRLETTVAGLRFPNPVGLAAGFDKQGTLVGALALLGFGHLEVGTVTPRPQPGNPRPRLFRLPDDRALINRLGFNSPGMRAVARRLACTPRPVPLGVNIGKNRATSLEQAPYDYLTAFMALAPLADYVTINISSPNTPGLRRLHERAALEELLGALTEANAASLQPLPLFLKVSPDESPSDLATVVEVGLAAGIAGFIAGNTTLDRTDLCSPLRTETGGLSGQPLAARARQTIAHLYAATEGRVPIIGVGGVASARDAYRHIRAGATLVQLYTGLIYEGPGLPRAIKRGLVRLLHQDGFRTVGEAVGADRRRAA